MSTQHGAQAVEHLEQARSAIEGLAQLRTIPEHSPRAVAGFYDEINQNMKLADIEAQLYIGDSLNALLQVIEEHFAPFPKVG